MKTLLLFASLLQAAPDAPLTIEAALQLANERSSAQASAVTSDVDLLRRRHRYPSLRVESSVNSSRTLDIFSEGPLELHAAQATLALDWPIYDNGLRAARLEALEARSAMLIGTGGDRTLAVIDAFANLALASREEAVLEPIAADTERQAQRAAERLERGDVSILEASERDEAALALRTRRLDVEARRIEAASQLGELIGREATRVDVDLDATPRLPEQPSVMSGELAEAAARVKEAEAAGKFQLGLSAFTGLGTARSTFRGLDSDGSSGVYGVRVLFSLPIFEWEARRQLAEARAREEEVRRSAARIGDDRAARTAAVERAATAAEKRIALLSGSVDASRLRLGSLQRLVDAGVRTESELSRARIELVERELALLAARVDRWRFRAMAAALAAPERTAR
jgi:outer membrane protein TolC